MAEPERLQKYLARAGVGSRRHCEGLITEGRVSVNGAVVTQLGTKVVPDDVVTVDGVKVAPKEKLVYVILNKPTGTITSVEEQYGRPTVVDLLKDPKNVFPAHYGERQKAAELASYRLFPVGRLDLNTEGLLLLTNDGELANRMTHPRYAVEKEYLAVVNGKPSDEALSRLRSGVDLEEKLTVPAQVSVLREENGRSWLTMVIHEGRKRQVRLMFAAVGHQVSQLKRTRIGPLHLGSLPVGSFRFLSEQEVESLKRAVGISQPRKPARPAASPAKRPMRSRRPTGVTGSPKPGPKGKWSGPSQGRREIAPGSRPKEDRPSRGKPKRKERG